jgi:hypothetical protein
MRRVPGLIVVSVLALAGCGGGSEDEDAVKQTISDFSGAMEEKDTKTACSLLTERAKGQLAELGKQLSADSCEKTLSIVIANDDEFATSFGDEAKNVEVTGGNAKAEVGDTTATLIKEGEGWKIDVDAGS